MKYANAIKRMIHSWAFRLTRATSASPLAQQLLVRLSMVIMLVLGCAMMMSLMLACFVPVWFLYSAVLAGLYAGSVCLTRELSRLICWPLWDAELAAKMRGRM